MEWKTVTISKFLKEREGKYEPRDKAVKNLKRIDKIDFSGNFCISKKPSNTKMIIIKSGDLVISGINVAKGAFGVYEGKEDIAATIHYSSYEFDEHKINIEYFKRFLRSPEFTRLMKEQVKGGIKTEIKPKHLLPLQIKFPPSKEQSRIYNRFLKVEYNFGTLSTNILYQQSLLKKLRQSILQEAVQGKLTAKWRKENRNVEPATELLKRIKAEKEKLIKEKKIKKQKPLPPIKDEEIPFELPKGWCWCRLGKMIDIIYGKSLTKAQTKPNGAYPVYGSNGIVGYYHKYLSKKRSIIIGRKGSAGALNISLKPSWTTDVAYYVEEMPNLDFNFLFYLLSSLSLDTMGRGLKPGLNRNEVYGLLIALPPLPEQKKIVVKIEILMTHCDELENQIDKSKVNAELLMQAVLREAFKE